MAERSEEVGRDEEVGRSVRQMLRRADRCRLSTALARDGSGAPYGSLALLAVDQDATPLLLLSDLADHSRNLKADPRIALLIEETEGFEDPLEGARASLLGRAAALDDPRRLARFVRRHPSAELYAGFRDFRLYAVTVERAHLVAGFGRIHWIDAAALGGTAAGAEALAAAEAEIVEHMNQDHAEAVRLIATVLLARRDDAPDARWLLTGVDPEGADLRRGSERARIAFDKVVHDAESCRVELVRLTRRARAAGRASAGAGDGGRT
jgi:putative heme iron utilization protein